MFFILSIESDANFNIATKGSKINWGRSPNLENMTKAISYWTKKEGDALDVKGNLLVSKAMFASKVGIPWKMILPYIHPYPKRRKKLGNGMRGEKKNLVTKDIEFIAKVSAQTDR